MPEHRILDYALAAAHRGWAIFPIAPGAKNRPLVRWSSAASTDPGQVRAWWRRWPEANYGIATGPSGLLVVDLDTPKPGERPPPEWDRPGIGDGADVLAELVAEHDPSRQERDQLLETFAVATASGGRHWYYRAPDTPRLGNTTGSRGRGLGWLIDTRGHGGYVVGPGSRTAQGAYLVENTAPAAPLPSWIARLLAPPPTETAEKVLAAVADSGRRRSSYAAAALRGETAKVAEAAPGQRNTTLYIAAVSLGQLAAQGLLEEAEIRDALTRAAAAANGADAPANAPGEVAATITSGLRKGRTVPRRTRTGAA